MLDMGYSSQKGAILGDLASCSLCSAQVDGHVGRRELATRQNYGSTADRPYTRSTCVDGPLAGSPYVPLRRQSLSLSLSLSVCVCVCVRVRFTDRAVPGTCRAYFATVEIAN